MSLAWALPKALAIDNQMIIPEMESGAVMPVMGAGGDIIPILDTESEHQKVSFQPKLRNTFPEAWIFDFQSRLELNWRDYSRSESLAAPNANAFCF